MTQYSYTKLDADKQEIRILSLFPGLRNEEPIHLAISHESFVVKSKRVKKSAITKELLESLPINWYAYENLEGRIIYNYMNLEDGSDYSTWQHPDPSFIQKIHPQDEAIDIKPDYEALSYAWGTADNSELVYICSSVDTQGENFNVSSQSCSILRIGGNLACALRYLRYKDRVRTLWVDAVCINQSDLKERSAQVSRMGHIYRLATRVVVWLGPENHKLAMKTLEHLGTQNEASKSFCHGPSVECVDRIWWDPLLELPYQTQIWDAISNFLSASWFQRMWVFQEIQLASPDSIMIAGESQLLWSLFRRAIIVISVKPRRSIPSNMRDRLHNIHKLSCAQTEQTFTYLICATSMFKCSQYVDKVYGILGLTPPVLSKRIHPDYNLSIKDVFRSIFLEHTMLTKRLELLEICDIKYRIENAPSWVLHFGKSLSPLSRLGSCACGFSSACVKYKKPYILEVAGVRGATVSSTHPSCVADDADLFNIVRHLGLETLQKSTYVTGECLLDTYAITFALGILQHRINPQYPLLPSIEEFKNVLKTAAMTDNQNNHQLYFPWKEVLTNYIIGRRFFSTEDGHIGFGPESMQTGDIICTILGCSSPLVLRRASESSQDFVPSYEVVGGCYLHGIMNGELILGPLPYPWEVQLRLSRMSGSWEPIYWNSETQTTSQKDPRLGNDSEGSDWESISVEKTSDDPQLFFPHRNKVTGEVINSDPRLLPQALLDRGVRLEQFTLV